MDNKEIRISISKEGIWVTINGKVYKDSPTMFNIAMERISLMNQIEAHKQAGR